MARRTVYSEDQHDLFKPETSWEAPTSLPEIPSGAFVAVDTETKDEGLMKKVGPGWPRRRGWVCGVSYAWDGGQGYLPVRHPDTACMDEGRVMEWLADLERRCTLVFQNAPYDLGWTGLRPTKLLDDTHAMGVLLDENRYEYNLDALCAWQGIEGKDETLLREAVLTHGGNPARAKEHIWRMPARYSGPYAEQDAVATLELARRMLAQIDANGLREAYDLERALITHVVEMRRRGIRINTDKVEQNQARLLQLRDADLKTIGDILSIRRPASMDEIRSPIWLEHTFNSLGVRFGRTRTGQGQFDKDFMEACPHPVAKAIASARKLHDAAEKFLGTYILDYLDMGRLHAEIHQLRDDEGGTRSYRFSYSNPPLQQMNRPEPDKVNPDHKDYVPGFVDAGTMIREVFEPEPGCVWGAPDYSQQEYRLIVHYAARLGLAKTEEAVHYYHTDPKADYHNLVVSMTGLTRKRAKDCNFAKAFGAGIPKFALMTGMSLEEATEVMATYDEKLPFVSQLANKCKGVAETKGYIRLIDGRRCRFDQWEASWIPPEQFSAALAAGKPMNPCSIEEARERARDPSHPWHGKRLRRHGTHKAGNRLIQGSAAVQTKKAMLQCAEEGHLPMLQMHDELCFSHDDEAAAERTAQIMREAVPLLVPSKVDNEFGPNWGKAKYTFREAMKMLEAA